MAEQQQGTLDPNTSQTAANGCVTVAIDTNREGESDNKCLAREQIKNLLWIDTSKSIKKVLEHWIKYGDALCTRRLDSERKRLLAVNQVIGFYSVFQGVLLTAVSHSNLLHCNNWWSAFSLPALASLVAFIGIIQLL